MYIHEAIAKAVKEEKYIERKKFENETAYRKLKIKPIHSIKTKKKSTTARIGILQRRT